MLILIISIIALILGIALLFISFKTYKDVLIYTTGVIGAILSFLGCLAAICCMVFAIKSHTNVEHKYQNDLAYYEFLQEQIDSDSDNVSITTSEMLSYNQYVMNNKRYYNSPWVGLYYYEGCEKLPLLEIKDKK